MEDNQQRCDYCYRTDWTTPTYSKYEILQIGCYGCGSVYNVIDDSYTLVGQRFQHPMFWKDLRKQWDKALRHLYTPASTVTK